MKTYRTLRREMKERKIKKWPRIVTVNGDIKLGVMPMAEEREMDFLWQTSRRSPAMTGLPVTVWVDDGGAYLRAGGDKRIWFQIGVDDSMTASLGAMGLDGNVIGSKEMYDSDVVRQIRNFVHNNKCVLETLADGKMSVEDVWPLIIRGGEPADDGRACVLRNGR